MLEAAALWRLMGKRGRRQTIAGIQMSKKPTTKTGLRISHRFFEVADLVDKSGSASVRDILPGMSGLVSHENCLAYCSRAVSLGLMSVDRSCKPMVFTMRFGWRDRVVGVLNKERLPQPPANPESVVAVALRTQPNSVWALGSMANA